MTCSVGIRAINALEKRIVKGDDDVDVMLWEQARRVVEQLDTDLSLRDLAAQWINVRTGEPYHHTHVFFVAQVFSQLNTVVPRPRFRDAYNAIANPPKTPKPKPQPEPFHTLNAAGDLRTSIEKLIDTWPDDARWYAAELLRDIANEIEKEHADVDRGNRPDCPHTDQYQVIDNNITVAS